jgi:hypothetical protein
VMLICVFAGTGNIRRVASNFVCVMSVME